MMERSTMSERGSIIKHMWNAFFNKDPTYAYRQNGSGSSHKPDRTRAMVTNERNIVASLYNRISMDVAATEIQHVRTDEDGRYLETLYSSLNECLTLSPNRDQTSFAFMQDLIISLFDEGTVAVVPAKTDYDPSKTDAYGIKALRVGKVLEWFPERVRVRLYNEDTGMKEDIMLDKKYVALIENPFYLVMNEANSTLTRLRNKLSLLDAVDEQSGSGKLDIIIQLPYVIRNEARKEQAEKRRKDIEMQLSGSKYGIAYTDGTEKITQLNRPAENNLMKQVEYLTSMLFGQLGLNQTIFDGTADEATMLSYWNRTVEPLLKCITLEMRRKYLTKTARSQHQSLMYFKEPFKLVPAAQLADIADKFTRNEILSSNEFRAIIGFKPSKDPKADELRNKNLNPVDVKEAETKKPNNNTEGANDNEI